MFKKKTNKHEFASTELKQINLSTLSVPTNMDGSSSNASSLSGVNGNRKGSERIEAIEEIQEELGLSVLQFKKPSKITTRGAGELTETRVSMDSLASFSSESSTQRIIMNGKPPRDFSKINIQKNYDARRGSANGINEINGSFGTEGYDSGKQEGVVSVTNNQRDDLSKSLRDVIRNKARSQLVQDSVTNTSKSKSSSKRTSHEYDQNKKTTGVPAYMRVCFFFVVLLLCAAGIGVLIHFLRKYESPDMATTDTATCIAYGVEFGKNLTIVCNTTFKNVSNISILMILPSSAEVIKLTSQNPYSDGWTINYTSKEDKTSITLIGPPANCSSGGEYNITITNNSTNTSLLSRITLDVNIYATISGNVTLDMPNYNCSSVICQSNAQCERSELHIYSMDLSSNSYCCKRCLDLQGCTAYCNVTMQSDIHNSTMKCTFYNTSK